MRPPLSGKVLVPRSYSGSCVAVAPSVRDQTSPPARTGTAGRTTPDTNLGPWKGESGTTGQDGGRLPALHLL